MALTQERLKELLTYSPETGVFHWLESRGSIRAGAVAGCNCADGYTRIRLDGVMYLAQRLAWFYVKGEWPTQLVDHENMDKSDNRWGNLRECSKSENARNAKTHSDAGNRFKGVSRSSSGRWAARICIDRQNIHLGNHDSPALAAAAYDNAARKLHGAFARTNGVA